MGSLSARHKQICPLFAAFIWNIMAFSVNMLSHSSRKPDSIPNRRRWGFSYQDFCRLSPEIFDTSICQLLARSKTDPGSRTSTLNCTACASVRWHSRVVTVVGFCLQVAYYMYTHQLSTQWSNCVDVLLCHKQNTRNRASIHRSVKIAQSDRALDLYRC
jgi:hypothetical protein